MEYEKTMEFGWTSDDGKVTVHVYKDNFHPDGAIIIWSGDRAARGSFEDWLDDRYQSFERSAFPIKIGRLGVANEFFSEYQGWKPLFWRFHWKIKGEE